MQMSVQSRRAMTPTLPYDRWLIFTVLGLAAFGLLMVVSASIVVSDHNFHKPFFYFYRQLTNIIFGTMIGAVVVQFEIKFWEKLSGFIMIGCMLLLALVLLPGIGHAVN